MLDEEPWSEDEHACFVQALQEQSGSINWHVTAHRIGTKSAQQVQFSRSLCVLPNFCDSITHPPSPIPVAFPGRRCPPRFRAAG